MAELAAAPPPAFFTAPASIVGGAGRPYYPDPTSQGRNATPFNTEAYDSIDENPFRRVAVDPLSTFSIDVDTASYANMRRFLNGGTLPPLARCGSRS